MTRIHLLACFHTIPSLDFSHCAFSMKVMRWAKMMHTVRDKAGNSAYYVIEYANEGSESDADEKVVILRADEFARIYPTIQANEFHGKDAWIGSEGWSLFHSRVIEKLRARIQPGDIVAHPFGRSHEEVVRLFPEAIHVETGIGYPDAPFNAFRIFESETWRHYHWGRDDGKYPNNHGLNRSYSWVVPNYYDLDDWPVVEKPEGNYVLYMGRIDACKGVFLYVDIMKAWTRLHPESDLTFMIAGQGHWKDVEAAIPVNLKSRVTYVGPLKGRARAPVIGNAIASLMPTQFVEPFGGSGIEGMLTGSPLIASDWGAFVHTIEPGMNGFRAKVMADWIVALEHVQLLDRRAIARRARGMYSLEACARKYHQAFESLRDLHRGGGGFYSDPEPNRLPLL